MPRKTRDNPLGLKHPDFEGMAIKKVSLSVRNAGDGLSKSLEVDPQAGEREIGEYVPILLWCDITAINHPIIKDAPDCVERVAVARAREGLILDPDIVRKASDEMRERIRRMEEDRQSGQVPGQGRIGDVIDAKAKELEAGAGAATP